MGLVYADIELINSGDLFLEDDGYIKPEAVRRVNVRAMVDTGAYYLAINENVRNQLGIKTKEKSFATLADGQEIPIDIVGPIEIRFKNRRTSVDAMVLPGNAEVLLGAIPMEGMDVVINPLKQTIEVNPEHPYVPNFSLK
ncbi:MAG: clan AA aspartic protease [Cytophagales bacterium]